MKRSRQIVYSVLIVSLFAAPAAQAEMFKWVNDDDTTTYSNEPPADPASTRELALIEPQPVGMPRVELQPVEPAKGAVENPVAKRETEAAARAAAIRPMLPPAVRDPCLTSPDPLCHRKNSARYRPYVGYTEIGVAEAPAVLPPPRGATSGAGATGALSGGRPSAR